MSGPTDRRYRQGRELADSSTRRRIRHLGPRPRKCGRMPARRAPMLLRGPVHAVLGALKFYKLSASQKKYHYKDLVGTTLNFRNNPR
jgi:hypothetical protein